MGLDAARAQMFSKEHKSTGFGLAWLKAFPTGCYLTGELVPDNDLRIEYAAVNETDVVFVRFS